MKKYIVTFGLTLLMGLFFANNVEAQGSPPWTQDNNWWTLEDNNWISVEGRLRAFERIVSGRIMPAPGITRFEIGSGSNLGANLEMYRLNDPTRPGHINFVFGGGAGLGQVLFAQYDGTSFNQRMLLDTDGNLYVGGKITTTEIEVKLDIWPDFVFADDYDLMSIHEVENYIKQNRHLPNVPSEAQVLENGVNVGEMTSILLQKVEELTLHIIELNKRIEYLEK